MPFSEKDMENVIKHRNAKQKKSRKKSIWCHNQIIKEGSFPLKIY